MVMNSSIVDFITQEWRIICVFLIIFMTYFHYTSTFDYFRLKGVPYIKPYIFVGNLGPRLTMKLSIHHFTIQQYKHFDKLPYGGIFEGRRPALMLRDPELIKAVLVSQFDCFVDRRVMNSNEPGYLSRSLLNLKGKEWKAVRSALTPTFSVARIKAMLPLMASCADNFAKQQRSEVGKNVEMKDLWGNYTLDVIGSCAFGIERSQNSEGASQFVETAARFADMSIPKRILVFFLLMFAPNAFKFLNISFLNTKTTAKLIDILKENKKIRRNSLKNREDFLQILLDTAKRDLENNGGTVLTEDTIDAQSLLFLIAGYETSSTLLSFASYLLATNPSIQEKLREHISEVLLNHAGEYTYECLGDMTYLEAVLLETLRLYPPLARVDRVCTKKTVLPGTNLSLEPGDVVQIPLYALHLDADHFDCPDVFHPERFLNGHRPTTFLPFGAGPRNCIGMRFALISAKIGLAQFLMRYKLDVTDRTEIPVHFSKKGILLKAENGLWVKFESLNKGKGKGKSSLNAASN